MRHDHVGRVRIGSFGLDSRIAGDQPNALQLPRAPSQNLRGLHRIGYEQRVQQRPETSLERCGLVWLDVLEALHEQLRVELIPQTK